MYGIVFDVDEVFLTHCAKNSKSYKSPKKFYPNKSNLAMCNRSDDFEIKNLESHQEKQIETNKCRKCDAISVILLRKSDPYCRSCFIHNVTHKFRATLGKSKLLSYDENIMLCFSGGLRSSVLLHLVSAGLNEAQHKRLLINPVILYIDEGGLLDYDIPKRLDICKAVFEISVSYKFKCYVVPLEIMYDDEIALFSDMESLSKLYHSSKLWHNLHKVIGEIKSLTSKGRLVDIMKSHLFQSCAKQLQCTKIFVATCATSTATNLLTSISLGQGLQSVWHTRFCDDRWDTPVLRPIRELGSKEVAFYCHFEQLEIPQAKSVSTLNHGSIQQQVETFVMGLQGSFSSTVSTLCKIGDKISANKDGDLCGMCGSVLDLQKNTAFDSPECSEAVSMPDVDIKKRARNVGDECGGPMESATAGQCCKAVAGPCRAGRDYSLPPIKHVVCYSCQLLLEETGCEAIPAPLLSCIRSQSMRNDMKKQIEDYLI